jgi:hypothetical protein
MTAIALEKLGFAAEASAEFDRMSKMQCGDFELSRYSLFLLRSNNSNPHLIRDLLSRIHSEDDLVSRAHIHFLILNGRNSDAISIALRSRDTLKHFASLLHNRPLLSDAFVSAVFSARFETHELATIATIVYRQGCVDTSLQILKHVWLDPQIARVYLFLLLNEGLLRRFGACSDEFSRFLLASRDASNLCLRDLLCDFRDSCFVCVPNREPESRKERPLSLITVAQEAIVNAALALPIFLFCIGTLKRIDMRPADCVATMDDWRPRRLAHNVWLRHINSLNDPAFERRVVLVVGDDYASGGRG